MDPILLARIQFAANISFHILFPTVTIALGWVLLFFKLRFNRTGDAAWMAAYRFWVKVFALSFALGVVSGVTMSFQFGTNWPGFMEMVGNVAGPLLAYEVVTAFFLEATFLAIMLFGFGRVSNRVHTAATALVAGGTSLSAFWILVLNSWMHTPAGHEIRDGVVHAVDWWAIIFNPSMPYRVAHMLLASGLTIAFLLAGLSAWRWLRGDASAGVQKALRTGVVLAAALIPLQILAGDLHGLNTLQHQPQKVAAMEGVWETERGAALRLFAIPDEAARTNRYEVAIPNLASLILTHEWQGEVRGLNEFAGQHPPVAPVFYAFRIMVGIGVLMLLVSWVAAFRLWRGGITRPLAWALFGMTFSGWVATLAGWYVTEIGRQPWLVTGILRTGEAAGPVPAATIGLSLALYLTLYAALLAAYIATLFHLAKRPGAPEPEALGGRDPLAPLPAE
ncbi:cytochrome ubiquinol oxidase subunit I [Paracraurococcus ruber]|uniref:Cytochrome ubiquinol oxidase subunit I n=1 Tax=Paracraurococcus ruber TaxID=77675 RepID=A0ABS1D2B8_9PROT|nr:cytochrome ubiquinol oxidase subunit I [Paracraurococcus ruber]MBK1660990.1 cytochrome ubiquinol oxidase subunit I [Paracraurococcus ruber]TDG27141.1 cytochrome ubiquinol oxidase subunit I [Paracraurococcus ruber]